MDGKGTIVSMTSCNDCGGSGWTTLFTSRELCVRCGGIGRLSPFIEARAKLIAEMKGKPCKYTDPVAEADYIDLGLRVQS